MTKDVLVETKVGSLPVAVYGTNEEMGVAAAHEDIICFLVAF